MAGIEIDSNLDLQPDHHKGICSIVQDKWKGSVVSATSLRN